MKKILLLILGVILFAGCVSDTQIEKEDKNNTFTPDINGNVNEEQNEQMNGNVNEKTEINEEENQLENDGLNQKNNQITYCKVDMGGGLIQEYYFSNEEVRVHTSIGNEWNEIILTPAQSCSRASDVAEEYCYPYTKQEFDEAKQGYMIGAQHMGTCN